MASVLAVLLLIGFQGSAAVFANPSENLSLSVTGTVLDAGSQVYTVTGGQVSYALVDGQTINPSSANFVYSMMASASGLSATGNATFTLTGTTMGGSSVSVTGTVMILGADPAIEIPLGCSTTCTSEIPSFFTGPSMVTTTIGGSTAGSEPVMELESPYLNPFGQPIGGLYGAGELGEAVGLLYTANGSNLSESVCFGRLAAEHALGRARVSS